MKTLVLFLTLLLVLAVGSFAHARPYLGIHLGTVSVGDLKAYDDTDSALISFDPGPAATVALGHRSGPFRIEGELGLRSADMDYSLEDGYTYSLNGSIDLSSFMVNAYYEFGRGRWNPFIGVGAGVADYEVSRVTNAYGQRVIDGDSDTVLAFQGTFGLAFNKSPRTSFDIRARYLQTTDADFDGFSAEYHSLDLMVGARFGL